MTIQTNNLHCAKINIEKGRKVLVRVKGVLVQVQRVGENIFCERLSPPPRYVNVQGQQGIIIS
jgi:hypothetical protein